jgi:DNA-binding transcriptional LysR family regulator
MSASTNRNPGNESLRVLQSADFNLLRALDALLAEESVAGAARLLGLSSPAVSRSLARLRKTICDPLLVRAGNRLVPTPRAEQLRVPVRLLVQQSLAILTPQGELKPQSLERTFTIRANEGFVGAFGAAIIAAARAEAPKIVLRFVPEGHEDVEPLRTGAVDLDISVIETSGPEVVVLHLFDDEFVGVVRKGHPLAKERLTSRRYVEYPHISVSRRGRLRGPIDEALAKIGLTRDIAVTVPTPFAAINIVAKTDLVAAVPRCTAERAGSNAGIDTFRLPVETAAVPISAAWHPRFSSDPGHRRLRELVRSVCRQMQKGDTYMPRRRTCQVRCEQI